MHKFLVNIRYFETPALIFATLVGLVIGGPWVWTGVVLLVASVIVDWATSAMKSVHCEAAGRDENGETYGIDTLLKVMMWLQYPVFVMLQLALIWRVYEFSSGLAFGPDEIFWYHNPSRCYRLGNVWRNSIRRHIHGSRYYVRA